MQQFDIDGYFKISTKDEALYFTVYPPRGRGKRVRLKDVLSYFEENNITDYDIEAVKDALEKNCGIPVVIGNRKKKEGVLSDFLLIELSEDELSAYLTILIPPEGGKIIKLEDIMAELRRNNIKYGIDERCLEKALKEEEYNKPILIARGIPPVAGEDAQLVYNFKTDKKIEFKEDDLRIDFKELKLIEPVFAGQILVKKIPPTKGTPGITVTGKILPPKEGRDINIPVGKNTQLSDDGNALISTCSGKVVLKDNKVCVEAVHIVDKDVDYSTGNIDFPGDVIIKGNVIDGFRVSAEGSIEVGGCIEKAFVCAGGNIVIRGGILGKGEGRVEAGGYIISRFIENCFVSAKRDIIVDESIMHSFVDANGSVYLKGRRGKIIGGRVRAGREIVVKAVGSWAEVETVLEVGTDPQIREQIKELIEGIKQDKENFNKVAQEIRTLMDMKNKVGGRLPADKEARLQAAQQMQDLLLEKLRMTNERVRHLQSFLYKEPQARICVKDVIYPGSRIVIHTQGMLLKQEYKYVTFIFKGGKIEALPYQDIKFPQELRRLIAV